MNTILAGSGNQIYGADGSAIIGGNITNFSNKPQRRVDLTFGIGYDDDLKLAKQTLMEILEADSRILQDPAPFVAVSELADSSVNFITRSWVESADYWDVYFETIEKVKLTFDEKGISIPYPQMDLHMQKND
jgi:small conductance mechanosensitive channel